MSAATWLTELEHDIPPRREAGKDTIAYELPLHERVRTLLRLEGLFEEMRHHHQGTALWDSRAAIKTLLAILSVFHNRPDTKAEVIKEMDRIGGLLRRYAGLDGIDTQALRDLQSQLQQLAGKLRAQPGKLGETVRKNDFIATLKQRENVPGGTLAFELPCYAYWLQQPAARRQRDITSWMQEFELMRQAVALLLRIIRESAGTSRHTAVGGFFQSSLETNASHQMIRVILPGDSDCWAEISGGRHRFSIRFMQLDGSGKTLPCQHDIDFQLARCAL